MTPLTRTGMAGVSLLAALVIAKLSVWSMPPGPDNALLRLSWRTQGMSIEDCRTLTEEELARIPAHMRRAEECVGTIVDYELVLEVDGLALVVDTVGPSGARHDRPVYVFQDFPVEPGNHSVSVRFTALLPDGFDPEDRIVAFTWEGEMTLEPRQIGLVTMDASGTALVRR